MPPADIATEILANTERVVAAVNAITPGLSRLGQRDSVRWASLGEILTPVSRREAVDPEGTYCLLGARWYAKGLYVKDTKLGSQIQARDVYKVHKGDFVYNRLFA